MKMADKQDEVLLNNSLKQDEIPIAIELAVALRTDEVDKFLELYDNIPNNIETEQVDKIKEMARQLAALPKKQFEMYRAKPKSLVSRTVLNLPTSSLNGPDKLALSGLETKPKDLELKEIFLDMSVNSNEDSTTSSKSSKKKAKKKKKKASTSPVQTASVNNVEMTSKDSSVVIENKLLDSIESSSRIATMNKNMVADISVVSPVKILNDSKDQALDQDHSDAIVEGIGQGKEVNTAENIKQTDSESCNSPEELQYISAPFGYPLSTDKLIQSAIELLSCEPSNDLYKIDSSASNRQSKENETQDLIDCRNISIDSPLDVGEPVDFDSIKDTTRSPDTAELKVDESIDGDISSLSAFDDDEGWQSQGRRSQRKKKKELQMRERSNSKGKKDIPKDAKQNNHFKRQNPRNSHNRNIIGKTNGTKVLTSQTEQKDNLEKTDKTDEKIDHSASVKEKEDKESNGVGSVFSYRDALLKAKPKPTEELHYNSDSGVDVNSVGSCDSAIHSPKIPNEFDLEEAVNYLMKGWNEVKELHKKGKVVYHKDVDNSLPTNKKKNFRKAAWHARPKHHIK